MKRTNIFLGSLIVAIIFIMFAVRVEAVMLGNTVKKQDLWSKQTVLVYVNPASTTADSWNLDKFKWLIAYRSFDGKYKDFFFDGFLITGYVCKAGRTLLPLRKNKPAIKSDWQDAIESFLAATVKLSDAFKEVSQTLNANGRRAKVILTLPYPDPRQRSFGPIEGKTLNFAREKDQLEALKWYIDEVLQKWSKYEKQGRLDGVKLAGFYWLNESIGEHDCQLVKNVSYYVHAKGYLMHWIPSYSAASIFKKHPIKELGLDEVTQQINYQSPDKRARPLTIFEDKTLVVKEYGMNGVEMTPIFRTSDLNPRVYSWQQVWLANFEAALRLDWDRFQAITYFNGNKMSEVGSNPKTHIFYEQLYKWTKGKLTWKDLDDLAAVVVKNLQSKGDLTTARLSKIKEADKLMEKLSVLEKLYWMERPLPEACP